MARSSSHASPQSSSSISAPGSAPAPSRASWLKNALPHVIAVLVFLIVAVLYCKPILEGRVVEQSDVIHWKGMAQQSFEFKEKHGHFPLWTNSMFSGMPAYTIAMDSRSNISIGYLSYILTLGLPNPIAFFFVACICFYFLAIVLGVNSWIGILSALAYSYCSFDPILVIAGHNTELSAIGYAPAVIAGLLLIFQHKYLWGAAMLSILFSFQVGTQHLQIVYYTLLIMGALTIPFLLHCWKQKKLKHAFISVAIAAGAAGIGFGAFAMSNLPVQENVKETMRGGRTELTHTNRMYSDKDGLGKDYAFQWSYGIGETFTLLAPDVAGGGTDGKNITGDSKLAGKLAESGISEDMGLQMANHVSYWGDQPFTSGPVYLGAVTCFLFILGLIYVKGWQKWWLLSVALTGIVLSWGKHFPAFNGFLFDHFPFYNKFRVPTMALFMPQFAVPLLGALGLGRLISTGSSGAGAGPYTRKTFGETLPIETKESRWKKFKTASLITGGLLILLTAYYFMADYKAGDDSGAKQYFSNQMIRQLSREQQPTPAMQQQADDFGNSLLKPLRADRQSLFGADLVRSVLLIIVAALLTGLYLKGKCKPALFVGGLLLLSSYDLLDVGRRYLSDDSYVEAADFEASFPPSAADLAIKRDPENNYRVFDETSDPFQDSRTSYFHNSLGGYHPAKLGLYQDIIEHQLSKGNMRVFDMLNAKYFIQQDPATGQPVARLNPGAYGPCWLVKTIHYVKDGNEEMQALDSVNTRDTVIIQQKLASQIPFPPIPDSTASLTLVENLNDLITYSFSAASGQFAVFSEVYYPEGWNVWVDGKKADYFRVDYLLRGMPVKAGKHTIQFRFEPYSYELGNRISVGSSILAFLLLIAAIVTGVRPFLKKDSPEK
jgi:hypothetical protein